MKIRTTITIDEKIFNNAKEKNLNVSALAEKAVCDKLNIVDIQIAKKMNCEFCGREGKIETADEVEPVTNTKQVIKYPNNLTWLFPDEKWICNACLKNKCRNILN